VSLLGWYFVGMHGIAADRDPNEEKFPINRTVLNLHSDSVPMTIY
jgi:hypothetical protein